MTRSKEMFYVIGLGSMGKRRIRNLRALGIPTERICGFDPSTARRKEASALGIRAAADFRKGFAEFKPTALIISTPPDKHAPYMRFAARRKLHFFVEVTTLDTGYKEVMRRARGGFVAAPSCTFRYAPAVQKLRELLKKGQIGRPLVYQHYLGQYLPDWHPYEDYRTVYFAKKSTGGAREMFPYELQWLNFIFSSRAMNVAGIVAKVSSLDIKADDVYSAAVRHQNGMVGSLHIDLLNRRAGRQLRIVGEKGTIEWDWLAQTITTYSQKGERVYRLPRERKFKHYNTTENIYVAEMKDFVDAVRGKKKYPYTFVEDAAILRLMYRLEKQSRELKRAL